MRALLQRVSQASVIVEGIEKARIGPGMLLFLGIQKSDSRTEAERLARKIVQLRVFADSNRKMNLSLADTRGELLIVSQFTLYADTSKGMRPSYIAAADPQLAQSLYEYFVDSCLKKGVAVQTGVFRAHMQVALVNDGPVTIMCDSES